MTTASALKRPAGQAEVKLYLKNDAGAWVDFSDRFINDRLKSIGPIDYLSEGDYQQPVMKGISLTLNNKDRYFDQDMLAAGFSAYHGHDAKVTLKIAGGGEESLGVFTVPRRNAITTDTGDDATLNLDPLTRKLESEDADTFKDGAQKYENRPWTFGVRELLRSVFGDSTGALPGSYVIPVDARYDHADGAKHFSEYGHPPQWDGSGWNKNNTDIPRSLDYDDSTGELFVGIGVDLWRYVIATDTWTNLGHDTPGATIDIRAVYVCDDIVVICKWDYSPTSELTTLYVNCYDRVASGWHATTRGSYADFFPGTFWYFNGAMSGGSPNIRTRGKSNIGYFGTNVHVPFEQNVNGYQSGGSVVRCQTGASSPTGTAVFGASNLPLPRNLYEDSFNAFRGSDNLSANINVRVAYGNKPNLAFDRVDGAPDCNLYMVFGGSTNPTQNIRRIAITRGSAFTATTLIFTGQGYEIYKHSLTLSQDKTSLGWIRYQEKADSTGSDFTQLMRLDLSGALPTSELQDVSNTLFADVTDMIVDIIYMREYTNGGFPETDWIFIKSNPEWVGRYPSYEIMSFDGAAATFANLDVSSSYFIASRGHASAYPVLYIDGGSGAVKKLTYLTSPPTIVDDGSAPVFDAPFAMDFRCGAGSDPDIWGLSAPSYNPDTQETIPDGKYYLWNYSAKASGRIPLMDCDGMNKWQAIAALCDANSHRIYVDRSGDFIVEPRAPSSLGMVDMEIDRFVDGWTDVVRDGETEIENFLEITPYVTRLGPMETTLHLRENSSWQGDVLGTQLDRMQKQVQLRCIKGGKITDGITRWVWRPYYSSLKTRLGLAYSSGAGTITVESAKDIEIGDAIMIRGSAERVITNISGLVLTLASSIAASYPILADVTVRKLRHGNWSSAGVTTITEALDSSETGVDVASVSDLAVGVRIQIDAEEMIITAISGLTLTVTRGNSPASHSSGAAVRASIAPTATDTYYAVGGQQIMVRWKPAPVELLFRAGDFIEFNCPGLKLEKQGEAIHQEYDDTSITKYGKAQSRQRIDNRFLDLNGAARKAKDQVARAKDPHKKFSITKVVDFNYRLFDGFYLKSPAFFPDRANNRAQVIVRAIRYDNAKVIYRVEAV